MKVLSFSSLECVRPTTAVQYYGTNCSKKVGQTQKALTDSRTYTHLSFDIVLENISIFWQPWRELSFHASPRTDELPIFRWALFRSVFHFSLDWRSTYVRVCANIITENQPESFLASYQVPRYSRAAWSTFRHVDFFFFPQRLLM